MRLQKFISNSNFCSRRAAEELIKNKKVFVNGELAQIGMNVSDNDIIKINNKIITIKEDFIYVLLNKPAGFISTSSDPFDRDKVIDLLKDIKTRLYPVGRLDKDTTGALLFTNDGDITNKLLHPKYKIEKTYIAKLNKIIKNEHLVSLRNGVLIENKKTSKSLAVLDKNNTDQNHSIVILTIYEGAKHQVKKMFKVLGYNVTKLHRQSFAGFSVENIPLGKYKYLKKEDLEKVTVSHETNPL